MLKRKFGLLAGAGVAAAVIALASFAFTASNTVPATKAGDGSGAVSGFVASNVRYGLNASDPSKADSVTFTLDSAPVANSTIRLQLAANGSWYTCSATGATVTCPTVTPQATVVAAEQLRVVVVE